MTAKTSLKNKKKRTETKSLSCTRETSLTKEHFSELYRFVKMTRMFDEITVRKRGMPTPVQIRTLSGTSPVHNLPDKQKGVIEGGASMPALAC